MPAAVRNVMIAARYATEGKLTPKGLPVMTKEEITTTDIVARALGIETAHMAEKSKAARSGRMLNTFIMDRRQELLDKRAKAKPNEIKEILLEMQEFSKKHPGARITGDTLLSSDKARRKAPFTAIRGDQFNKNRPEIERAFPELKIDNNDDDDNEEDDE
jgi:hypothetical protein